MKSQHRNGCRVPLRAGKLSGRVATTCHRKLFYNSLRIKRKYFKIPCSCQAGTGDNLVNISQSLQQAELYLFVRLRIDLMIPLKTIMKQIKQISPAEAFTGILPGDHLSCNLIKLLITGGRGLAHRTFLLHTSLLLLLHFTQVDIPPPATSHQTSR